MLTLAPTPIGNLDDLAFRVLDRLAKAEVFFCEDTRVTKKLLRLLADRHKTAFFPNPRFIAMHSHNEKELLANLDRAIFDRPCVYVCDAGMPCVSDPGAALVAYAIENAIEYEVLPGACAAIVAFAASGVTQKEFLFYGFLPHKKGERTSELEALLKSPYAVLLYESPHRIAAFADLIASLAPDRKIACFKELTKLHEKRFFGFARDLPKAIEAMTSKGEWAIVVFPAEARAADQSDWLVEALQNLNAPIKPLSKILAKLTGEKSGEWYEKLQNRRANGV